MRCSFTLSLSTFISFLLATSCALAQPNDLQFRLLQQGVDLNRNMFAITELSNTVYVEQVRGEARGQLERLDQFIQKRQWNEALEMLIRLSDFQDNKVVKSRASNKRYPRYVSVAKAINERLANLPKTDQDLLTQYRQRVDPLAEDWFDAAFDSRDASQLRRVLDQSFHSSVGDDGLFALGELALERGEVGKARRYWQTIHPQWHWLSHSPLPYWQRVHRGEVASSVARDLMTTPAPAAQANSYAGSEIPLADVWARLILCSILEGKPDRATSELAILRRLWPDARGLLRGKEVTYRKALATLLTVSRAWPPPSPALDWPTFAGRPSRNFRSIAPIDVAIQPVWTTKLKPMPVQHRLAARRHNVPPERTGNSKLPYSHFPIVVGDHVLLQESDRVRCLQLSNGEPAWGSNPDGAFYVNAFPGDSNLEFIPFGSGVANGQQRQLGQQRLTLSSYGQTLVATLGSHLASRGVRNPAIVGFDFATEGGIRFGPVELDGPNWTFLGAPLCDEDYCWVGMRLQDVTAQDHVACYDMRTGKQRWRTRVGSADTVGHNELPEAANHLLTSHEGTLYFSSHLGTVAAIDATDGRLRWITKYPRKGPKRENLVDEAWHALRDLTPCLYHDGMLIVAPSDTDQIMAFSADSGELIWASAVASDATQLLGVSDNGHLIASGRRLWWLDVYTGKPVKKITVNPFPSSVTAEPTGAGRGALAGRHIYWPATEDGGGKIFVFDQKSGRQPRQPIDLETGQANAGNLIVTPTHLLVAAPDRLFAFERDLEPAIEEDASSTPE